MIIYFLHNKKILIYYFVFNARITLKGDYVVSVVSKATLDVGGNLQAISSKKAFQRSDLQSGTTASPQPGAVNLGGTSSLPFLYSLCHLNIICVILGVSLISL